MSPSIGLHQRDNDRLIDTLKGLRDLGNNLPVVVNMTEDMMRATDYLVDIGPGVGEHGGQIHCGLVQLTKLRKVKDSITGQYLSDRKFMLSDERRKPGKNSIEIRWC